MKNKTFSDRLRQLTSGIVNPIGVFFKNIGVSPDALTFLGLVIVALGAWRLALGEWTQGALILLIGLPLDTLDGATARAYGVFRPFGSFLDSTMDRYADGLLMGALAYYFATQDNLEGVVLAIVALHGSLMVSYIRAKADSINVECKIGLFSRVERLLTLFAAWIGTFFIGEDAVMIGIIVLAIGTQFTSIQRLVHVSNELRKQNQSS